MSNQVKRLYSQFVPDHYELELRPDKSSMHFEGVVTIHGRKVGRPSQRLTFHQKDLQITKATVEHITKGIHQEVPLERLQRHRAYDEVRLHSKELLYPGEYRVTLRFEGQITRPMNGLYPCYFQQDGQEQILLATQFESHHAREVFPCIDEPEAKAVFELSLQTPLGETVIANTPIAEQQEKDGLLLTRFQPTPKMSTYLVAFVVGNLTYLEATTQDGITVRTYATPEKTPHTKEALSVAVQCLEFYNNYYGIPYPLAKCDLIALPDFAAGAMENWGAITFREQTLLVDPKNTSLPVRQYVAMVVAHELAHQWFGNLVTMRWWNDLWLNEGFASWMEYFAIDHLHPEWQLWQEFVVSEQEAGMRLDALEHSHPIEVPIHHPDEIRTIFDTISYSKGCSILHMLHQYLGADNFQKGLQHYLKAHAYGNTDTVDLWDALEKAAGQPVRSFMHHWTAQAGFPVVHVLSTAGSGLELQQERFYLNPEAQKVATNWPIPLLASSELPTDTLTAADQTFPAYPPNRSLLLNNGRPGFYRITYTSDHLAELAAGVAERKIDELNRLGILSDAFETAKAGYSSSVDALQLLAAYRQEANSFVWDIMAGGLGSIRTVMRDETLRESMKPYGRQLVSQQVERLGWQPKDDESHSDSLLRPTVLGLASVYDEPAVVQEALRQFEAMTVPEDLHPDLRGVIYGTAARQGDKKTFDKLLALHNTTTNSEERVTLSAALTSFKQPELVQAALKLIDTPVVRLQDASYWIAYSFMNYYGRDATWQWLTEHWGWLEENLGDDMSFYRFPVYAARNYSDRSFLPIFSSFFEQHTTPGLERPIKQAIETIHWQSAWRERDLKAILAFFNHL